MKGEGNKGGDGVFEEWEGGKRREEMGWKEKRGGERELREAKGRRSVTANKNLRLHPD